VFASATGPRLFRRSIRSSLLSVKDAIRSASMADERIYKVWLVLKNGYKLDGYYESGDARVPAPGDIIEVKSLSGGSKRARITGVTPAADPPIQASEIDRS
jgi:hypothetical protein